MSKTRSRLKYILPIFLSCLFVLGYYYFLRADIPAKVQFTADTILSLQGLIDGDIYIAQNSECDSLDIAAKDLTVNSIPFGKSFILKTIKHDNALKITSASGDVSLDFSSDNFSSGDITSWTMGNVGVPATADIIWGVPAAETWYKVKANGSDFRSFLASTGSEIAFSYSPLSPTTFTLELNPGGGGSSFVPPKKPDVTGVRITTSDTGELIVNNLPANVTQIAISSTPDFKNASWENIADGSAISNDYSNADKLYIEFRTKNGGVSDIITYALNISDTKEGDIVKTKDNFDVYIIKYMSGKRFKRLILSPSVFESYEHLEWENIRVISQKEMDSYTTSTLVKVADDATIYELFPQGDTGERKVWDLSDFYDADSVYEINKVDRDSYILVKN